MYDKKYISVKRILWIILFANFLVAFIKLGVGIACKSQSVTADGIHSFADGSSNIIGLIGIWLASKPADSKHPYGHEKFEIIASLFIGAMLATMSAKIFIRGITSIVNPTLLAIDYIQLVLMLITIIINIIVAITEYRQGKKLKSTILVTDSLHTRGDILISLAVLGGLIGIKFGVPVWIDGLISIAVAIAVFISAAKIITSCVNVLVDGKAIDCEEIRQLLLAQPEVIDVHNVRSRGVMTHTFIELHIIINPCEDVNCSHILSHKLESILKEHYGSNTEVNIHVEPDDGLHNSQEE